MEHINQMGNIYDLSQFLIEGGHDGTYFSVVHVSDQPQNYIDYPSVKDGKELCYGIFDDEQKHQEYWKNKTTRARLALKLTVAGNAVCCKNRLKDMGYDAHAVLPDTVMVVIPDSLPMAEGN